MNTVKDSIKILYAGAEEQRSLEFKRGLIWEHPSAKSLELIKGVIAMFNTSSGGDIILGIYQKRNDSSLSYIGLKSEEVESLIKKEEIIKDTINGYTTVKVKPTFTLIKDSSFKKKKDFLVINVPSYKEYPCLIKKNGEFKKTKKDGSVEKGFKFYKSDLLTRSLYPKYSSRKVEQEELNEMIELCAKGLRTKSLDITETYNKTSRKQEEILDNFEKEREKFYGDISA